MTMDEAVQLIAERAAKGPSKPKGRRARRRQEGRGDDKPPREAKAKAAQAEGQAQASAKPAGPERRRSRFQDLERCPANPKTARREREPAEQARDSRLSAHRRRQGRQARDRARLRIKGSDRIALKRLLAEMAEEGLLAGNRKGFKERGNLPPVTVLRSSPATRTASWSPSLSTWDAAEGERPRALVLRRAARPVGRAGARPGRPHPGAADPARGRATSPATATRPSRSSACRASSAGCSASSAPRRAAAASSIPSTARS